MSPPKKKQGEEGTLCDPRPLSPLSSPPDKTEVGDPGQLFRVAFVRSSLFARLPLLRSVSNCKRGGGKRKILHLKGFFPPKDASNR